MKQLLTVKELSEYLNVSEKTIYNKASEGGIPSIKAGGALRFDLDEIQRWLQRRYEAEMKIPDGSPTGDQQ